MHSEEPSDMSRALNSMKEEIEAIDWYNQRMDLTTDKDLMAILKHNRDEEKEHVTALLEWIRRNDKALSESLEKVLFTKKSVI